MKRKFFIEILTKTYASSFRTHIIMRLNLYILRTCQIVMFGLPYLTNFITLRSENLGVAITSDGGQEQELDVPSGKATAVMRALHHSVVSKRELSRKAKLLVFKSILVPIFTFGYYSCVMTNGVPS